MENIVKINNHELYETELKCFVVIVKNFDSFQRIEIKEWKFEKYQQKVMFWTARKRKSSVDDFEFVIFTQIFFKDRHPLFGSFLEKGRG